MADLNSMVKNFLDNLLGTKVPKAGSKTKELTIPDIPGVSLSDDTLHLLIGYINTSGKKQYWWDVDAKDHKNARLLMELDRREQVDVVLVVTAILATSNSLTVTSVLLFNDSRQRNLFGLKSLLSSLLRKKLPFEEGSLCQLLQYLCDINWMLFQEWISVNGFLKQVEYFVTDNGLSKELSAKLTRLKRTFAKSSGYAESRKVLNRIRKIQQGDASAVEEINLKTGEAWTSQLQSQLDNMEPALRNKWYALLTACQQASSAKPTKKWLKETKALIENIGTGSLVSVLLSVLPEIGKPGPSEKRTFQYSSRQNDPTMVHTTHCDLLRGLVWSAGLVENKDLTAIVGDAADVCFKKIPDIGPRAPKIGNACLYALASSSLPGVAQLSRLEGRVKHASSRKQVAKALDLAAANAGMSKEELAEISVPSLGLTAVGELRRPMGDHYAMISAENSRKTSLRWFKPDGKEQKSIPAALKVSFSKEVKELKKIAKEIEKLLPAQRNRIERLFLDRRSLRFSHFREHYLDHPLTGVLARRLIWRFRNQGNEADGIWCNDILVDARDNELSWITDDTEVELWHPLNSTPDDILAWRNWLDRNQVQQPFKQAHREIYLLTGAERETGTYSNRFAAHILKQHQFSALCRERGWHYTLQGQWDSHNVPFIEREDWGIRVEFWVDASDHGGEATDMGIFLYLASDQVRFHSLKEAGLLSLEEVPALFFSELMRDVDLFVGVSSVGNNPNWNDGGPESHYYTYWQNYSFGSLSQTAKTRKEVLERLLPRLKIADRCSFSDKFLVVRGDLRTYKIHLGSSNILMSPNDQYLCIVAGRGASAAPNERIFLPFEGDSTLSLILSKAFLLAEDSKIKDPVITGQIKGK